MHKEIKILSTDVLIIGGGIAALVAANKAVEQGVDVILADKSTVSFSGQMPLSGGNFICAPPDKVDMQTGFYVEACDYLNDQEYTETFVKAMYPAAKEVADWGPFTFDKDFDGNIIFSRGGGAIHAGTTHLVMPMMLERAMEKGARTLNKLYMIELLKKDDRVVGAAGFHYHTGEFHVILSKSTILACGGCMYKSRAKFHVNNGEGIVMAYNAGAELRNAEFGNLFHHSNKYTRDDVGALSGLLASSKTFFKNAQGQALDEKYPELLRPSWNSKPEWMVLPPHRMTNAWIKEIEAGNGPIYLDLSGIPNINDPKMGAAHHGWIHDSYGHKLYKSGVNIAKEKVEWDLAPEFHQGPVRVDINGRTTIPGLYAAGDLSTQGSACFGAIALYPGGNPLMYAMVSAIWAGSDAAKTIADVPDPEVGMGEIQMLMNKIYTPLGQQDGYDPYEAIKDIQTIVFKVKHSCYKSKERLEEAQEMIEEVKEKLSDLSARDSHELVRCHEAASMVTSAEILYNASIMRTESRGSHLREDFPERDDKNWLKWVIVKKTEGRMELSIEPIPLEKYKYKPTD